MPTTAFQDLYPASAFALFCRSLAAYRAATAEDASRQENADACLDAVDAFDAALLRLMLHKSGDGSLESAPHSKGRGHACSAGLHLLSSMAPSDLLHISIPAPSGRILLADWFRTDEFTSAVKAGPTASEVHHAFGRAAAARRHAREFGFMSVSVGETFPCAIEHPGHFATAIDFDTLVAPSAGSAPALAIVNAHLGERDDVVELGAPPGSTLHISFHDEDILGARSCSEAPTAGRARLSAVLSTFPLDWRGVAPPPQH